MLSKRPCPVFVASLPRSGSTWVAETLGSIAGVTYYHEPFNFRAIPEAAPHSLKYLRAGDVDPAFARRCRWVFGGRARHRFITSKQPTWKRVWPLPVGRTLVKDVHSMLALGWIQHHVQPMTVMVTRHPCAFAESWSRLSLKNDRTMDRLVGQPRLWTDHLAQFADVVREASDFWERMGIVWGAAHYVARRELSGNGKVVWVRHEDLCRDPIAEFRMLCARLGLPWSDQVEQRIARDSTTDSGQLFVPQRLSINEVGKWRSRLEPSQVEKIRRFAAPFGLMDYEFPEESSPSMGMGSE